MVKVYEPMVSIAPSELVAEQRREFGRIGAQRRLPGLTLYEYDLTTGEIREATVETRNHPPPGRPRRPVRPGGCEGAMPVRAGAEHRERAPQVPGDDPEEDGAGQDFEKN